MIEALRLHWGVRREGGDHREGGARLAGYRGNRAVSPGDVGLACHHNQLAIEPIKRKWYGRVTGPMTVTVRDRRRAGRSARTYATLRPGFSVTPNTPVVRRVTLPASALPSLRRGDLELQVRTRPAGPG